MSAANLDSRTVGRARLALVLAVAAFGVAYLLSEGFRSEVDRSLGILDGSDRVAADH